MAATIEDNQGAVVSQMLKMRKTGVSCGWLRLVALVLLALAVLVPGAAREARAALEIDITRGNIQPLPIAIHTFNGAGERDRQMGANIAGVITANLQSSGLFVPLNPASFIQKITAFNKPPRFGDWRIINAQALVTGRVRAVSGGKIRADFVLWDVFGGQKMTGGQFTTTERSWRRLAHRVSDEIYKRLTGESGYFDTQIVFVEESGPKGNRLKRVAIMDQDGFNQRYLTNGRYLVLTPRFSPNSREIAYLSYASNPPRVYLQNILTGQSRVIADFPGMSFAPRFSPDGRRVVMSLQHGGHASIYTMDIGTGQRIRLTNTPAIDTGPSYAPDGRQIVFESDRGGTQQIYVMNADGSNQRRISFGQGRYATPVWSPRGDLIAFTKILNRRFLIGVMRPDGSGERILTEGYHNEGPTWSPNGRVLMFFRESRGANAGPRLWSVDLTGYNERQIKTPAFASDPAWSPLIN